MTPERMARLVVRWARFYTRRLPPEIAQRRVDEIQADLHDHIAHEREQGMGDRRIAVSVLARMLRGLAAVLLGGSACCCSSSRSRSRATSRCRSSPPRSAAPRSCSASPTTRPAWCCSADC